MTRDAPIDRASCAISVKGLQPPLNIPFRCLIRLKASGKGYTIAELLIDGLTEVITQVSATVRDSERVDLLLDGALSEEYSATITLPGKLMSSNQLASIPLITRYSSMQPARRPVTSQRCCTTPRGGGTRSCLFSDHSGVLP